MKARGLMVLALVLASLWLASCRSSTISGATSSTIEINAPIEKVFAAYAKPIVAQECAPKFAVSNVKGQGLGMTWDWTAENAWIGKMSGSSVVLDYVPNQRIVKASHSSDVYAMSVVYFIFQPGKDGNGTTVTIFSQSSAMVPVAPKSIYEKGRDKNLEAAKKENACIKAYLER